MSTDFKLLYTSTPIGIDGFFGAADNVSNLHRTFRASSGA